ncbi:DNA-processing protein DprA [Catenibacillus scindens]|uniref:DNA-processing protein DprA n=1 Tax=Catenibacillus scindens TaxID=673271 RepID=UPI00320793F3
MAAKELLAKELLEKNAKLYLKLCCYWLCSLIEFGIVGLSKFVEVCGGIEHVFSVKDEQISASGEIPYKLKREILKTRDISVIEREYNKLSERGISFVGCMDEDFPEKLKYIANCPFGLFYKGVLPDPDKKTVAIVGARNPSPFGLETARHFGEVLAYAGVQVISGLALGIDGRAHAGALEAGHKTWGILGCGVNICYPQENIQLFEQMKTQGGIISEFKPGQRPLSWHFPFRNRIISGLSDGIVVVEARKKSGSLITAGFGLEQGKDIFAVPGRPVDELSEGCNSLILDGATMVTGPEDILEDYKISVKLPVKNKFVLDNLEKLVYPSLCLDAKSIEQIAYEARLDYTHTAKALLSLSVKGCARQVGKNYYIKKL